MSLMTNIILDNYDVSLVSVMYSTDLMVVCYYMHLYFHWFSEAVNTRRSCDRINLPLSVTMHKSLEKHNTEQFHKQNQNNEFIVLPYNVS